MSWSTMVAGILGAYELCYLNGQHRLSKTSHGWVGDVRRLDAGGCIGLESRANPDQKTNTHLRSDIGF